MSNNGLEVRNDSTNFESVIATTSVKTGKWYYEMQLLTAGVMQVGWANKYCSFSNDEGRGVGDDMNGFAFDGYRKKVWMGGECAEYGSERWKEGDVVGAFLDLDEKTAWFTINGVEVGGAIDLVPEILEFGLYPAISLMAFQNVRFNFGKEAYKHSPPSEYHSLNSVPIPTIEPFPSYHSRLLLPKLAAPPFNPTPSSSKRSSDLDLSSTRSSLDDVPDITERSDGEKITSADNDDAAERPKRSKRKKKCAICFDLRATIILKPCGHNDLCERCALLCETCPMCRAVIEVREVKTSTPKSKMNMMGDNFAHEIGNTRQSKAQT